MATKPNLKCVTNTAAAKGVHMENKDASQHLRLPSAYVKLRNIALEDLHGLMATMFGQADDVFFECAEKAGSNQDQEADLAAMREVRLQRKNIERKFYRHIAKLFKDFPDPLSALNTPTMEAIASVEELSIMQVDEVEENVAVESMVSRAADENTRSLQHLTQRLDLLAINVTVSSSTIPLAPKHICGAFRESLDELTCEIKHKLIVYKLFERHVLNNYQQILERCNQLLIGAGVLTELKDHQAPGRNPAQQSAASSQQAPTVVPGVPTTENESPAVGYAPQGNNVEVLAGQVHELMASIRGSSFSMGAASLSNPTIGSLLPSAKAVELSDLISVLSRIESAQPTLASDINSDHISSVPVPDVLNKFYQKREVKRGPEKVTDANSDVINLVSMLFDFILDDRSLPAPVKVLIGRLQIPMIKVAMLDQSFFTRSTHPARKLLNGLARAGIGLSGIKVKLAKDPVYEKIRTIVQQILNDFTDDVTVFEALEKDFSEFMDVDTRRAVLIEQRTKTAEEGRAKSDVAKLATEKAITDCIGNNALPEAVTKILSGPWSKVLYLSHLKEGSGSRDFQKKVMVVNHLIRSVTTPENENERKYLYDMEPMLLKRLREGFDSISFNPFEANELITALEAVQREVLTQNAASNNGDVADDTDAIDSLLEAISQDIHKIGKITKKSPDPELSKQSAPEPRVTSLDITRKPKSPAKAAPSLVELPSDDEDWLRAESMVVGSWVNINETPEKGPESAVRCKLAAYIKSADRMIFVNRSGIKVAEHSRLALAYAFKEKSISVIDDALLFDKALENVIGGLRKVRQTAL
ncbi:hypothetical protein A9Q99_03515 [Gammaproteobacteria bacterium 45_16_T64]|nr:hypothetical protein A9Q99_03515 [Gammaproteobacteria bacterium 45_16_T64]